MRSRRPKPAKLAANPRLQREVQDRLEQEHSPKQIAQRLRRDFPDDREMWVTHETIYKALYVQGRGELRRDLAKRLRTGRAVRQVRRTVGERRGRIPNMVNISQRPAEVADRAVPGHWEGDVIVGPQHRSAIGTLVERQSRLVKLIHLARPDSFELRDGLLRELAGTDPTSPAFDGVLRELVDAVTHHVEEEESSVLPGMRDRLDDARREELGRAFAASRARHLGDRPGEETREELLAQARNAGVSGASGMSKAQLERELHPS